MSQGSSLEGGRELLSVNQDNPLAGSLFNRIIKAINRVAQGAGVGAIGELPAPEPVNFSQVQGSLSGNTLTAPGEILHFVHTHNSEIHRGIQYLTEVDTNPNFTQPHVIDTGSSRSGFANLPAKTSTGATQSYYLRVTPQLPGSQPQKPTVFGGTINPTKIQMTGSTQMDLLPSQSAGTAFPGQSGQGLGKVQQRSPVDQKRKLSLT